MQLWEVVLHTNFSDSMESAFIASKQKELQETTDSLMRQQEAAGGRTKL